MTIELATCGHFAAFDLEGRVLRRICTCPNLAQPRTASSAVARETRLTRCPKCVDRGLPGIRTGGGPHSPHLTQGGRLVDCAGDEVPR